MPGSRSSTGAGTDLVARDAAEPIIPQYGRSTLGDLLPSVAAHLDVPGFDRDVLGLPDASRYVVLLVDGLGWHNLVRHADSLGYLGERLAGPGTSTITAGVPATTVTSLTSLGTGLPPGSHGIVGYSFWLPEQRQVLNPLLWDVDLAPAIVQPWPTVFDAAATAGVLVTSVSLNRFAGSGLTLAALRGAEFAGFESENDERTRISLICEAAARRPRSLVYAYERELDHTGHAQGVASPSWLSHLHRVDRMCRRLREELPSDTVLIITADHGMIDVPPLHQIVVEDKPGLMDDVAVLAGEGRLRQLYLAPGADADVVVARWTALLGERAWVLTREAAIAAGWFGAVRANLAGRIGDVLVALRADWAVMTRAIPRELTLVGMHGSLTPAEMDVPLIVHPGR